jgi:hypothetical protein
MGMELSKRGPACKNCKAWQFWIDSLSYNDNAEHEVILSKLRLDQGRKKWIAWYGTQKHVKVN